MITFAPGGSQRKRPNVQGPINASTAFAITQVLAQLEPSKEVNYAEIANLYEKLQSYFVFGVDVKHKVYID